MRLQRRLELLAMLMSRRCRLWRNPPPAVAPPLAASGNLSRNLHGAAYGRFRVFSAPSGPIFKVGFGSISAVHHVIRAAPSGGERDQEAAKERRILHRSAFSIASDEFLFGCGRFRWSLEGWQAGMPPASGRS